MLVHYTIKALVQKPEEFAALVPAVPLVRERLFGQRYYSV
jgi:hypothetical protein